LDEVSVRVGSRGIINTLRKLGIIAEATKSRKTASPLIAHSSYWIRSKHSGLFRAQRGLGKWVKKGEILGWVGNPVGAENQPVHTPHSGMLIGVNRLPVVHEGQALFNIACPEASESVEKNLLDYQTEYDLSGYFDMHTHLETQ
jgi:hypothetical protein